MHHKILNNLIKYDTHGRYVKLLKIEAAMFPACNVLLIILNSNAAACSHYAGNDFTQPLDSVRGLVTTTQFYKKKT